MALVIKTFMIIILLIYLKCFETSNKIYLITGFNIQTQNNEQHLINNINYHTSMYNDVKIYYRGYRKQK
jgi:hypothetical protein